MNVPRGSVNVQNFYTLLVLQAIIERDVNFYTLLVLQAIIDVNRISQ